jgi:hypothetical protein
MIMQPQMGLIIIATESLELLPRMDKPGMASLSIMVAFERGEQKPSSKAA